LIPNQKGEERRAKKGLWGKDGDFDKKIQRGRGETKTSRSSLQEMTSYWGLGYRVEDRSPQQGRPLRGKSSF